MLYEIIFTALCRAVSLSQLSLVCCRFLMRPKAIAPSALLAGSSCFCLLVLRHHHRSILRGFLLTSLLASSPQCLCFLTSLSFTLLFINTFLSSPQAFFRFSSVTLSSYLKPAPLTGLSPPSGLLLVCGPEFDIPHQRKQHGGFL